MKIEHVSQEWLYQEIINCITSVIANQKIKIFIFGSRVNGKNNERSDIDVGILGSEKINISQMAEIRNKIEEIKILYKIDIVDFNEVSEDFKKVAFLNTEIIYG